ncbi:hypothetical protein [Demequina muriae]|uniref:Uncharacterized protein n=1 Tax=Demequina muriae TaxID=3051664 RepID=A0ABT8GEL3_9MICO|nr:hypothetical protein [Demequina sp. EGI L300058]MDN4479704.1 hypothetical protein [Demequina sp. EGI L300058]
MTPSDSSEPLADGELAAASSPRMTRAWRFSTAAGLRADHNRCSRELADKRAAVELAREELLSDNPDPLAESDIVLLLHNLVGGLLAHQDCDESHVAEALDYADEAVDRQARVLVQALNVEAHPRIVAEQRWVLADEVGLRETVRSLAGLGDF